MINSFNLIVLFIQCNRYIHYIHHRSILLLHVDLLEKTVRVLDGSITAEVTDDERDIKALQDLKHVMNELFEQFKQNFLTSDDGTRFVTSLPRSVIKTRGPGRPAINIPREILENLRGCGFSWCKVAKMFKVSRWTIMRRVQSYGLERLSVFSSLTDEQLDNVVRNYMSRHGTTTGKPYLRGHFRALGHNVQRWRVRESINRVDPRNTALRWGALVSRRVYNVTWPNSLWHLDGHHSLIRWRFVIHGCIDGYSRRIIFL